MWRKKSRGLATETDHPIESDVIFGKTETESPYVWKKGEGYEPLIDEMGITHNGRSETVSRALSDFGSEESFGHGQLTGPKNITSTTSAQVRFPE